MMAKGAADLETLQGDGPFDWTSTVNPSVSNNRFKLFELQDRLHDEDSAYRPVPFAEVRKSGRAEWQ